MKYFGTDGIRDRVGGPLLAPDFLYSLGKAIGCWIREKPLSSSPHVLIGRDTRESGTLIMTELCKGLSAAGVKIFDGGVCPTPSVAHSTKVLNLEAGIMITASHNPATDNGIKIFTAQGTKLSIIDEAHIEELIDEIQLADRSRSTPPAVMQYDTRRHYVEWCASLLDAKELFGLRIVVDAANGATYHTTPEVLQRYGANVITIGTNPTGTNINLNVGSEVPQAIANAVVRNGADLGIAHDGDGDRVILCDNRGNIIDGDAIMAILANAWAERGELPGNCIVMTIMSNAGLDKALAPRGVKVLRTDVGDRNVFYEMQRTGAVLGGEASGHFIAANLLPTGDGLITALLVLKEISRSSTSLHDLAKIFAPFPQLKKNIAVAEKVPLESLPVLQSELTALTARLGDSSRILLRYSGTEPKIRLLAEAADSTLAESTLAELEAIVVRHLPLQK